MNTVRVALLRGINVGRAKRIAMADLREEMEKLGYRNVRTVLNSGNVVFTEARATSLERVATTIQEAIRERFGIDTRTTVLTASEFIAIVDANPLLDVAVNPSRLLIGVMQSERDCDRLRELEDRDWGSESFALGERVAYVWCPEGVLKSRLNDEVSRLVGESITARNWNTITKIRALLGER